MDTRAQLSTNQIVLVRTPAFYGYYQYKGLAARLELQQQDYGNVSLWESLTVGSQDASLTKTIIHPTTIKSGDLITDPSLLVGVTLRLNTPLTLNASGYLSASAGSGLRISATSALTLKGINSSGVINFTAPSIAQDVNGTGIYNDRGPIELRSTGGNLGSSIAPIKVTTAAVASLHSSNQAGNTYISSSGDLALGSLVSSGTLSINASGALRDAGRSASDIGVGSANLQAPNLLLSASSFGTAVSPLLVGGGSSGQQTTLNALSTGGSNGLISIGSRGTTPVLISSLSVTPAAADSSPNGSVWLSGDGFASISGFTPIITAASLVLDGLTGLASASAPLRTSIMSLAGSVGSGGLFLSNNQALSILKD
jgi:hypothetical protein